MKSLLLVFSKTDKKILSYCTKSASLHQQGLGLLVFLTAIFAFISSFYALTTVFGEYNLITKSYELYGLSLSKVIVISLAYSIFIGAIDREIVSSRNKLSSILRIPMAIIISLIIAIPMELKILEKRIDKQLFSDNIKENQYLEYKRDAILGDIEKSINKKELIKDYYRTNLEDWKRRKYNELIGTKGKGQTGIKGKGIAYNEIDENIKNTEKEINKIEIEIIQLKKEYNIKKNELNRSISQKKITQSYDLWSRYTTMKQIIREDETGAAKQMTIGLTFLFILLELTPALVKMMSGKSEYDTIIELIAAVNKQKADLFRSKWNEMDIYDDEIMQPLELPSFDVENIVKYA